MNWRRDLSLSYLGNDAKYNSQSSFCFFPLLFLSFENLYKYVFSSYKMAYNIVKEIKN